MNLTLLLTACVNPGSMPNNMLTNTSVRESQYIDALRFYLEKSPHKIVFAENSNSDFSEYFSDYIDSGRLEYITFQGNDFDLALGKGYGEGQIIKYAFEHSKLLNEANNIMKITGRLQLFNIKSFSMMGGDRYSVFKSRHHAH